ncbi:MAG: hypothetical protein AAGL68_08375 [Pseudomonadota bacterium]
MKKLLVLLLLIAAIAGGVWFVLRDDGVLEQVTEERVKAALLANRLPEPMADCMAPKLTDRLTIAQLLKLEKLKAQDGETALPLSTGEAMARLRRVDDRQAVETLVRVGGGCGVELIMDRF